MNHSKEQLTIIKVGGKVVETPKSLSVLLKKFSTIDGKKILVHGGGRLATSTAEKLGIPTQMIDGRRVTDEETLKVVTMVYAGLINKQIVAHLQALNLNALGLSGADLNYMRSDKRPIKEGLDYGFVGDVKEVDGNILEWLISKNIIPVLSPITHDKKGYLLNTNADTIAGEAAKALADKFSVKLVFCFEKKGVLYHQDNDENIIPLITPSEFKRLTTDKIIVDGMIPKLENAFDALDTGVHEVVISRYDLIDTNIGTILRTTS